MDYDEEYNKDAAEKELQGFNDIVMEYQSTTCQFIEDFASHTLPSWNPSTDPVKLMLEPLEEFPIDRLIQSDNKLVNKVVLALVVVCKEAARLVEEAETDLYIPILLYESSANSSHKDQEEPELLLSKILPTLHRVSSYVKRVYKVSVNILQQLSSIYPKEVKTATIDVGDAHFQVVFEHLGRLFGTLITLDEVVSRASLLHTHWNLYKKLVKSSLSDPSVLSFQSKDLVNLDRFLNDIDKTVMKSNMFKGIVSQPFDTEKLLVTKNNALKDEMATVMLGWCSQVEQGSSDGWQSEYQRNVLSLSSIFVFHHMIFNVQEKKLAKAIVSLFKKHPCIVLGGEYVWLGEKYLKANFPSLSGAFTHKTLEHLQSLRINQLTQKVQSIASDVNSASVQMSSWCVQMSEAAKRHVSKLSKQDLNQRILVLLQGILNGRLIRDSIESLLALHTCLGRPMPKHCAISICRMLEILKSIEVTFQQHSSMMAGCLPHIRQYTNYQILAHLNSLKSRLSTPAKDFDNKRLDTISAFTISQSVLSSSGSKDRLLVARVSLSLANQKKVISEDDLSTLLALLRKFDLVNNIESKFRGATETSFLYHHRVLIPIYLEDYFHNLSSHGRIQHFLLSLEDCSALLKKPHSLPHREELLDALSKEMQETIHTELLDKVCKEVETDLRLSTHHHLQLDNRNPFDGNFKPLSGVLQLSPLIVFGKLISVKEYVEQHLERVFYGLSVVAPHDCSAYEMMHHMAFTKYGLTTVPSHLPSRTVEQVVDVLDIMRNINIFVQQYHYNLNQQFFLETDSNNKHLNVVTIKDIANSIRTHGTGIISTAVNYTYQFLRQKFHLLSQFLYDEHIRSRLMKDLQFWKEAKVTQKSYPYERAERFHRGIKKLGISPEGLTYLDQFRKLVTVAGNAIGYVRLIRTARLHCSSASTQFIPNLQNVFSFSDLCPKDASISEGTLKAAENLDKVITDIRETFYQDTDYFQMMVKVFAPVVQQPKNSHLRNFFLIIPPLTINYIEYILASKENLNKKYQPGCTFTEDGFAMGVAYLLRVLNQTAAFESLHWWSGIRKRFAMEKEKVEEERQRGKASDTKLQQTLSLSMSRLNQYEREFELLFLCLSSAQVLFKTTETNDAMDS